MSFSNLKRKSRSEVKSVLEVEEFIQQAERYAQGEGSNVISLTNSNQQRAKLSLKASTFTLSCSAKEKLDKICQLSGVPRSRILRILLMDNSLEQLLKQISSTKTR